MVFWGLRLSASQLGSGAPALAAAPTVVDVQSLVRLLGGTEVTAKAAPAEPTRYTLVGVLAGTRSGRGAALIEVDGKPAKPFRVGAQVADGLVLQSVSRREARLGASVEGATSMTLQMPLKSASAGATSGAGNVSSTLPAPMVRSPMMPQGITPGIAPGIAPTPDHPALSQ